MTIKTMTPQQKAALALDRNIAVSAGAGSGKTWVLVQRYLTILDHDNSILPGNIVAITFTRKAAAEMRERIRNGIHERLQNKNLSQKQRRRFAEILDDLPRAPINTIHGFIANILREFAIPAGLDPGFTVLEDDQLSNPVNIAVNRGLRQAEKTESEAYRAALHFFDLDKLRKIINVLTGNPDSLVQIEQQVSKPVDIGHMFRDRLAKFDAVNWLAIVHGLPNDETKTSTKCWKNLIEGLGLLISADSTEKIKESLNLLKDVLFTNSGTPRKTGSMRSLAPVAEELQEKLKYLPEILQASEKGEDYARIAMTALIPLVSLANQELDTIRHQTAMVTFDDLEQFTWQLLTCPEKSSQVLPRLRERYRYFMIDEFQDTNQRQWDIIRPLVSDENGDLFRDRLFIVGDPKQSIYGFRKADITVFNCIRKTIVESNVSHGIQQKPAELAPGDIHMDHNFRSRPVILEFTDIVCAPVMTGGESYEVMYESLSSGRNLDEDYPEDPGGIAILAPSEIDTTSKTKADKGDSGELSGGDWLDIMVSHLANLVKNDRFQWQDIAIMYPARTRLPAVKKALRKAIIPFSVYKGVGFWQQPEIRDLLALIKWIADSNNRLALYTILRSPLFGISDPGLLLLTKHWSDFPDSAIPMELNNYLSWPDRLALDNAWDILLNARNSAGILPLSHILETFMSKTGGWGSYKVEDDSGQIDANIEKLLDIVMGLDREGVAPLWETADYLAQKEAFDSREGEAVTVNDDDRVTLLTVHAAKGLEFPVVYLLGLEKPIVGLKDNHIWNSDLGFGLRLSGINPEMKEYKTLLFNRLKEIKKNRELAENKRLLYVAFTRARDRLFLVHQPSRGKILTASSRNQLWLDWILAGMDKSDIDMIRHTEPTDLKPIRFPDLETVKQWLDRDTEPEPVGIAALPESTKTNFVAAVTTIHDFLYDPEEYTKKHILHMVDHFRSPDSNPGRETARYLGNAYHQLMEQHPDLDDESIEKAGAMLVSELVLVSESDRAVAVERLKLMARQTRQWLLYEDLRQGHGFHELPFNIYLDTGIVHGIIDLLIKIDAVWHVVDYKTDRKPARTMLNDWLDHHVEEHRFQMSVYMLSVLEMAPEQTVFPAIIYFADVGKSIRYEFSKTELLEIREKLKGVLVEISS
ncbi:UvrD-helicase domain-containing protein [bacterium]|nr:UvrD-helicase domain-containing protein [bacterium]